MTARRWTTTGAMALLLAGFGYLLLAGIGDSLVYFVTPSELHARGEKAFDSPVRLGGQVVDGSVDWNAEVLDLRFRLRDDEREMEVHSTGAPPAMFRPGIDVVVEGRLGRDGIFRSTNLMVRHSNEYEAAPHADEAPERLQERLIRY